MDLFHSFILFLQLLYNYSQRMLKNKQVVLEHPFHPLDLSPHDLLAIYKRFQQSRLINRNPKQQLPIQSIAQLISSLKGCPPSYIQKCISQALIKQTISWNEFLTFLDQESEVREKILEWLMHEKTTVKYREEREWQIRAKISKFYEEITFFKFIQFSQSEKLILCSTDKVEYYLFSHLNGKINIIDSFSNKSSRTLQDRVVHKAQEGMIANKSIRILKNESKVQGKKNNSAQVSKSLQRNERLQKDKYINSLMSSSKAVEASHSREEEQAYDKKQRKNINSLFNVFKDLQIHSSIAFARIVSQKLNERSLNPNQVSQIKEAFLGLQEKAQSEKKNEHDNSSIHHIEKAKMLLGQLHREKKVLSYNPYQTVKNYEKRGLEDIKLRKNQKERKEREHKNQANQQAYNDKLKCMAIIYFNMDVVLLKISRQYNKTSLQEQDRIKIVTQNEHKKNEVIQAIDFYYHSIVNKWFLIILIRVEYKNEMRNINESYIRGYEIELLDRKGRGDKDITFKKSKKEAFSMMVEKPLSQQQSFKYEIFKMQMQLEYGIHFISVNGKYICYKEDFVEVVPQNSSPLIQFNRQSGTQHRYFTFHHEQRFKNSGLSLSCLSISLQLNKIAFGTIRGALIIYDMFSHAFKVKKACNSQISEIRLMGNLAYMLTIDEKLIVYDLIKVEEVQHLSVKNENKLHEKIKNFEINKNIIYFYGTEVRSYHQYVDEKIFHEKRMMQTIYKWRLDKLFREESSFTKNNKYKDRSIKALLPNNTQNSNNNNAIELLFTSENYFLILSQILQLMVVDKKTLKIKFTMILGIPHDSKVMKMSFSMNEKLLALLLFNQNVYIFNIYTQDLYQHLKPSPFLKYTTICFLDNKNQFLLANGTENGNIILSPYSLIPEKSNKNLQFHKKSITSLMIAKKEYLVAVSQDNSITIWLLPFNVLKYEIKLQAGIGMIVDEIGCYKQMVYLRSIEGNIIQVNSREGKLVKNMREPIEWKVAAIDNYTGELIGIAKDLHLEILAKNKDKWTLQRKKKIESSKSQIKFMSIVQSQKLILFYENCAILPWFFSNQKFGKLTNLCQE